MSSGIIFNSGPSKGNPFSLGVNLPAPIVTKYKGNLQYGLNSVKQHGADIFYNGNHGVYDSYSLLGITMPNVRYNNSRTGYGTDTNFFQDINKLNPKIFMFKWNRNGLSHAVPGSFSSSSKVNALNTRGTWSHPPNILDNQIVSTYSNFSNTDNIGNLYPNYVFNPSKQTITAGSEWEFNFPTQHDPFLILDNLNPFRFYNNTDYPQGNTCANAYFNYQMNFFGSAYASFQDWIQHRKRNGANNIVGYVSHPGIYTPSQRDFNVYLSFALVIQNPSNTNQYIIGQLSKPVKQSLLMGINSGNQKVPKAFKYTV